jgi:hypothetical protein
MPRSFGEKEISAAISGYKGKRSLPPIDPGYRRMLNLIADIMELDYRISAIGERRARPGTGAAERVTLQELEKPLLLERRKLAADIKAIDPDLYLGPINEDV